MVGLSEADVEELALDCLSSLGWAVARGRDIAPDEAGAERDDYGQAVLGRRLRSALARLNPTVPEGPRQDAARKITHPDGAVLEARNRAFHRMAVDGVGVEYRDGGRIRGAQVQVFDFDCPQNNDWLAVNQFTVVEGNHERRLDIVLFVNGLPLGVVELKNPAHADATVWSAWQQLQTYKA
ncbi:MAG: type I restriction endonuclease, partial [bacterium]|nr:type I restriction endonuclease [bacterium]